MIPHLQASIVGPTRLADPFEVGFEVTHDPLLHVAVGGVLMGLTVILRLSQAHIRGLHRLSLLQ